MLGFYARVAALLTIAVVVGGRFAAAGPLEDAITDQAAARGVVLIAAKVEPASVVQLAEAAPVLVMVVSADTGERDRLAAAFEQAGANGQVTVAALTSDGKLPLADHVAATSVVDLSAFDGLDRAEVERVTRPLGTLMIKGEDGWSKSARARPEGMDNWPMYHHDPQNSEHSADTIVGPPLGLQWQAGPTNRQHYTLIYGQTTLTEAPDQGRTSKQEHLLARDTWTGLPLWEKPWTPISRFAVVMDEDYVYVHPVHNKGHKPGPHTVALDRATGELVKTYDQGMDFTVTEEEAEKGRGVWRKHTKSQDLQLRLIDGLLIQVNPARIVVLDAETGERKWSREVKEGVDFSHPVTDGEALIVSQGPYVRASSYTHWPMNKPTSIHCFRLSDGKPLWTFDWPEDMGELHSLWNLQIQDGLLAGAVAIKPNPGGKIRDPHAWGLILDARTGEKKWFGRQSVGKRHRDVWPPNTGAGHSIVRMLLRGDRAFTMHGTPLGVWSLDAPDEAEAFADIFEGSTRPVSCNVVRSTPNWWYLGVNAVPFDGHGKGWFNQSGRSECDIGAIPAGGLLFSPPNTCGCQAYLPGLKAYHSRRHGEPMPNDQRLEKGTAKPADTADAADAWPQLLGGPDRRNWAHARYPQKLKQIWTYKAEGSPPPGLLESQWETDGSLFGPVTQPVVAGDVVVFARGHRQEIVALDAATGELRWRTAVDGRVDTAPSIFEGLVLAGTRTGWVYALNLKTGELVWRFFAAPRQERIVVNGQLESFWPVTGSIPVDEHGLIAVAGRHTDNDGGMWWWQLDPQTGAIQRSGRLGPPEGLHLGANQPHKLPLEHKPMRNSVSIMTESLFQLPCVTLKRVNGGIGAPTPADAAAYPSAEDVIPRDEMRREISIERQVIQMGLGPIIGEGRVNAGGFKTPWFANLQTRLIAVDPDHRRFVTVGGGRYGGRGGAGGEHVQTWSLREQPVMDKNYESWAKPLWDEQWRHRRLRGWSEEPGIPAMAAADNVIYLAGSVTRREWFRNPMNHRLIVLDLETAEQRQELPLPGHPLQAGIALSNGRVYVATEDGSITAFDGVK